VADATEATRALASISTNTAALRQTLVVEHAPEQFQCRRPADPVTVETVVERANAAEYRIAMGQGRGYLLVADSWSPAWTATIDGEPAPILRADLAFRAVALPEGDHVVRFDYRPWSWQWGLPLLSMGAALTLLWWLLSLFGVLRPRSYDQ
jgi:hypothetical protein